VKRGFLTIADFQAALVERNFEPQSIALLVNLLQREIEEAAELTRRRAELEAQAARRQLSLGDIQRAVRLGLLTILDYGQRLQQAGFSDTDRLIAARILEADMKADEAARRLREAAAAAAAVKRISLTDLERAVRAGVATMAAYRGELARLGFELEAIDLLVRLLELDMAKDRAAVEVRKRAEDAMRTRRVTHSEVERAVLLGVVSIDAYTAALKREGFPEEDSNLLRLMLMERLRLQAAKDAIILEAGADLAARQVSLEELERQVRDAFMSIEALRSMLLGLGQEINVVEAIASKLLAEQANRELEQRREAEISVELATRGLSLSQFQTAVREGLRSLEEYGAFLTREGYGGVDIELLQNLLALDLERRAAKTAG